MAAGKLDLPADLLDAPKPPAAAKDKKFKKVAKGSKKDVLETTMNKKRKLEDKGIFAESRSEGDASTITIHETSVLRGHKIIKSKSDATKSKSLQKKTRKKDKSEVNVISVLPSSDNQNSDDEDSAVKAQVLNEISCSRSPEEASNRKTSKGMKKKKIKKLIKSQGNQISEKQGSPSKAEFEDVEEMQSIDEDCSRKKTGAKARVLNEISSPQSTEETSNEKVLRGMKKKNRKITKIRGNQILGKQGSPSKEEFEDVEEIQSVDEDCSRGMKKWLIEYHESRPGVEVLHNRIDEFITSYEEQKQQERKERDAQAAEGGWTVVVHHKGRKKTTDSESGVAVGSVAQAAVVDNLAKKKSKEPPIDFYRFQKREAQRNEVMMLQSKFEQDKKRIQQLRAARKFRPY